MRPGDRVRRVWSGERGRVEEIISPPFAGMRLVMIHWHGGRRSILDQSALIWEGRP